MRTGVRDASTSAGRAHQLCSPYHLTSCLTQRTTGQTWKKGVSVAVRNSDATGNPSTVSDARTSNDVSSDTGVSKGPGTSPVARRVLPERPSLENPRNQAKTLQKRHCDGDREAVERVASILVHDGALEAAFRGSERPLDVTNLMGDSGLGFRVRWATRDGAKSWGGSGPCGEWPEEVEALNAATGYVFRWEGSGPGRPASELAARIAEHIGRGRRPSTCPKLRGLGSRRPLNVTIACANGSASGDPASPEFGYVKQEELDTWTNEVRKKEIALLSILHELDMHAMGDIQRALIATD